MSIETQASQPDAEYADHITNLITARASDHVRGQEIHLGMVVCGLEPNRAENRKVREFAVKTLKIKASDFDAALRREAAMLAGYRANTPRELVECVAAKKKIIASYNGLLRMNAIPYLVNERGGHDYISPNLWESYEFRTMIETTFKRSIGFDEFARSVRIVNDEYKMPFAHASINDAAEQWYSDVSRDRLWQIAGTIDYTDRLSVREQGQNELKQLVENCFEVDEHGADFAVAMFNKFIWQVKRKIKNMLIYDHLMLVILGSQGTGKSTLIMKLLKPVEELYAMTDFKAITDDRNISLWRNYVIFLDEMGWASKSDMDIVKNVITAKTLTRRVMRTNVTQEVAQNATFIGAANADELAELIRDQTGTRRFASLTMIDNPDRALINRIEWQAVWQSVDEEAEDPMAAFRGVLQAAQEENRSKSTVEEWIGSLEPSDRADERSLNSALREPNREFTSTELYGYFRDFERDSFPAHRGTNTPEFGRKMTALSAKPNSRFVKGGKKTNALWTWRNQAQAQTASVSRKPRLV
jgi:hypothetical protein